MTRRIDGPGRRASKSAANPMDRAYRLARSDELTTIELATEHIIGDDVVAILDRSRIDLTRRIVEAR
jgi:hypothetical protein